MTVNANRIMETINEWLGSRAGNLLFVVIVVTAFALGLDHFVNDFYPAHLSQ